MDVKFNSLFDNQVEQENTDQYLIGTQDTTLLLSNLVLQMDEEKTQAVEKLESRQFGSYPNYILSGRPCSARQCSSGKFCESSGWPESPVFKRENTCEMPVSPNSSRGDPNIYIENIDIEAKLRNIDYVDNKCHLKKPKEEPCSDDSNSGKCAMKCHKNITKTDYRLPNTRVWDTNQKTRKIPNLGEGIKRSLETKRKFCEKLPERFNEASKMQTFMPTKRRDIIDW